MQEELQRLLAENPIYHVVVRGNDKEFMPQGYKGQDVVTNYFVTGFDDMVEYLLEKLEEIFLAEFETPIETFQSLVQDAPFVNVLEEYYKMGDQNNDKNLKLFGRLSGSSCLLHRAIKENQVDLVRTLLDHFTRTSPGRTRQPWLWLAEPFMRVGKYKVTAFHLAAYDARPECLELLLRHADSVGALREVLVTENEEDRQYQRRTGRKGMTALELAEFQNNRKCYNILAHYLGKPTLSGEDVDARPREDAFVEALLPRFELIVQHGHGKKSLKTRVIADGKMPWAQAPGALEAFIQDALHEVVKEMSDIAMAAEIDDQYHPSLVQVNMFLIAFSGETSSSVGNFIKSLLGAPQRACESVNQSLADGVRNFEVTQISIRACFSEAGIRETVHSMFHQCLSTSNAFIPSTTRVLVGFLPWSRWQNAGAIDALQDSEPDIPNAGPDTSAILAEFFERSFIQGDASCMLQLDFWTMGKTLLGRPIPETWKWMWSVVANAQTPMSFLLKNYRKLALQRVPESINAATDPDAAALLPLDAAVDQVDADQLDPTFRPSLDLLVSIQTLRNLFYSSRMLIFNKPDNAADALEPQAAFYVEFLLMGWLKDLPGKIQDEGTLKLALRRKFLDFTGWQVTEEDALDQSIDLLVLALDKAVATLLRMDVAIEHVYRRVREDPDRYAATGSRFNELSKLVSSANFTSWMRELIPEALLPLMPSTYKYFVMLVDNWEGEH
mmetsp:Transcript_92084/g.201813  ORF Transcript_92084/g.201813 Transcript_92084/m.201813 type:complete len:726 (-) Transcript_92084:322-2499(-)